MVCAFLMGSEFRLQGIDNAKITEHLTGRGKRLVEYFLATSRGNGRMPGLCGNAALFTIHDLSIRTPLGAGMLAYAISMLMRSCV